MYETIISELLQSGHFKTSSKAHRILYEKLDYPVDIVPFGGVSDKMGTISWPDREMSILGFEEAYRDSFEIIIGSSTGKTIRVASPVGLVIMKFVSWSESIDRAQ